MCIVMQSVHAFPCIAFFMFYLFIYFGKYLCFVYIIIFNAKINIIILKCINEWLFIYLFI